MSEAAHTSSDYIKHHLQNLTYGELPAGYAREDHAGQKEVLQQDTWTLAQSAQEAKDMGFWSYNVDSLGVSIVLEGISTWKAVSAFNATRAPGSGGIVAALKSSKDPTIFAIVLEDVAALAGLVIAFLGITAANLGGFAEADGIASILIGCVLGAVALFLSREIKSLIVGEAAAPEVQAGLASIFEGDIGLGKPIRRINDIRTMHLGPDDVLVTSSVDFQDYVTAATVESVTARLQSAIKSRFPEVKHLFIEVQSEAVFEKGRKVVEAPHT